MRFARLVCFGLLGFGLLQSPAGWAFPENVRHGYTNCVSCHVNPNGQGLLNPYGRQLSKAMQSYGKFFFEPTPKATPAASANASTSASAGAAASGAEAADADRDPETEFLYG